MIFILRYLPQLLGALLVFTVVGTIYAKGRLDASHASQMRELQLSLDTARATILKEKQARIADAFRAKADSERLAALDRKTVDLETYIETLEDSSSVCLSPPDTDKLRDLWD